MDPYRAMKKKKIFRHAFFIPFELMETIIAISDEKEANSASDQEQKGAR